MWDAEASGNRPHASDCLAAQGPRSECRLSVGRCQRVQVRFYPWVGGAPFKEPFGRYRAMPGSMSTSAMYVHVYMCMYVYIYMYLHTYVYII